MNQKQFKYVFTLANEGSFSRAADALNISQPSLSQFIKKVELQIGTELFDRSNGNVRLTDAGEVYIEIGRKIFDLERQLESRLQDIMECRCGTIRMGISAHRSACLMPPIVTAFKKLYPGYQVILDERVRGALIDAAEHGEFDFCVTTLPVDENVFHIEKIFNEEMVLAVPAHSELCTMLEGGAGKIDINQLNGANFVVLNEDHPMQHELEKILTKYNLSINRVVECKSLETMMAMIAAGMGAALVPVTLKNFLKENIVFFSVEQKLPKRDIVMIYRKDQRLTAAMTDFMQLIKAMIGH